MNFFIMMNNQKGTTIMPIVDGDEEVMLFETEEEAEEIASLHPFCKAFGYEIFERGTGR
jgi:hypothetical protein